MQLKSLTDTYNLSSKLSTVVSKGDIVFFFGEIGVGKTTFIRFLINYLEKKNNLPTSQIISPTFNIVYDYDILDLKILHYDLYRLKNDKDIDQLGIFENKNKNITFIEWPELIAKKPNDRIEVHFQYSKKNEYRNINFVGFGKWRNYEFLEI